MKPGFSTSEDITEVSGRGVGLDVVKTNIEKLGGTVEINSVVGRSTAITVKLPLTLAIIPAQIIEAAGNRYAVPQVNLEEIVVAGGEKNKYRIENIDGKELLDLRGELLPLLDLNRLLKIEANHESQGGSERDRPGEAKPATTGLETRRNILILNTGTNRFGLGVTEFLDSEEIVVKPLSAYMKRCRFYSGATILGDGQVAMILDVAGLAEEGRLDFRRSSAAGPTGEEVIEIEQTDTAGQFLMFENAPDEYFALPLALITRIDRIKRVDLKTIDGRVFYNNRDRLQRIIFLHDYLKASPTDTDDEFIYAILPRLVSHPVAVGAARLNDIITTGTDLNFADHTEPGIIGSAIIDKKPTVFLDLFGLLEKAAPELYNPEFSSKRMNPGQILLVESNPIFKIMLENYLSAPGIDPITAATKSEALKTIQEHNPDLVLTSLRPSLLDIESLIRQARELPGGERITFIGLTEHQDDFNTRATLRKQFADEVLKFDKYSLLSKLATDAPLTRPEVK
jgi:two-component system chemotaxis sensor kinase CheA